MSEGASLWTVEEDIDGCCAAGALVAVHGIEGVRAAGPLKVVQPAPDLDNPPAVKDDLAVVQARLEVHAQPHTMLCG